MRKTNTEKERLKREKRLQIKADIKARIANNSLQRKQCRYRWLASIGIFLLFMGLSGCAQVHVAVDTANPVVGLEVAEEQKMLQCASGFASAFVRNQPAEMRTYSSNDMILDTNGRQFVQVQSAACMEHSSLYSWNPETGIAVVKVNLETKNPVWDKLYVTLQQTDGQWLVTDAKIDYGRAFSYQCGDIAVQLTPEAQREDKELLLYDEMQLDLVNQGQKRSFSFPWIWNAGYRSWGGPYADPQVAWTDFDSDGLHDLIVILTDGVQTGTGICRQSVHVLSEQGEERVVEEPYYYLQQHPLQSSVTVADGQVTLRMTLNGQSQTFTLPADCDADWYRHTVVPSEDWVCYQVEENELTAQIACLIGQTDASCGSFVLHYVLRDGGYQIDDVTFTE